jgi:hypothetical protein
MKKTYLLSFILLGLWFIFPVSIFAQIGEVCITVTTGACNAVGGNSNFTANQLNWSLTDATSSNVIEYDYRMGNCGSQPDIYFAGPINYGGFTFGVIDSTGNVWQSYNPSTSNGAEYQFGQYGNVHCTSQARYQNGFDFDIINSLSNTSAHPIDSGTNGAAISSRTWGQAISDFLDSIPNGCIIVMYAVSEPPYAALWTEDSALVNKLAAMGATDLKLMCDTARPGHLLAGPYIFFTIKGNPSMSGQAIDSGYTNPLTSSFCFDTSTTTGLKNISPIADLHVYPNPSTGSFAMTIPSQYIGSQVSIIDELGRLVKSFIALKETESVQMDAVSPSVYTVRIGQYSQRISIIK